MNIKFNNKGTVLLTIGLLFGLGNLVGLIKLFLPAYYSTYLFSVPAYFLLVSLGLLFLMSRMKRNKLKPGRVMALLMLFNVGQMALSFSLLFFYYYFIKIQMIAILLIFCIFYFVFMWLKFYIMQNFDRSKKQV